MDDAGPPPEEALRRRYQRMLEHVADRVSLIGPDGVPIEELGPGRRAAAIDASWTPAETISRCHPDDRERLVTAMAHLFSTPGASVHDRFTFSDGSGGWMTLEMEGVNRSDDPVLGATLVTTRDVTESERAARELAEARDQALRALDARGEFVATVSHELRTPIHGILGLSELLADAPDEQTRRIGGAIFRSAEALRLVVDDILDLSKLEAGRLEIVRGPIDVAELRDDLTTLFRAQATAKGIELHVDVTDEVPEWVWSDGLRVRQIITNLVGNAVKFTDEGEVRVTASAVAAPGGGEHDLVVRVTVSDTGIGVPDDLQDDLLDAFSRAHARTSHRYGGTGLGLVITSKLLEALDGTLHFESRVGEGSEFTATFPVTALAVDDDGRPIIPEPAESSEPHADPTAEPGDPVRHGPGAVERTEILVVEDNPVNQLLVARQLEVLGYHPTLVADGETALRRFLDHPPAAVLMDLRLPGIDGLATAARMRASELDLGRVPTPIIAMTASGLAGDREQASDVGMDGFLSKPVGLSELREALTTWCGLEAVDSAVDLADGPSRVVVDTGVPDQLVDELDDPALVAHLCELFVGELESRTSAIVAAAHGTGSELHSATHTLRSVALTLGATALVELCEALDQPSEPARVDELLAELDQLSRATAHQLTVLAGRYRAGVP